MAERPIECSQCKKPINVTYKEIASEKTICSEMCTDCPILAKKLHGKSDLINSKNPYTQYEKSPKLYCAICMTTAETIQTGNPLGCNHCYTVFEELLLGKLLVENLLSSFSRQELQKNTSAAIHRGKLPNQSITIPLSNQLSTLNEALNEALKKEHYEQAAWLRDQIRELKEKTSE